MNLKSVGWRVYGKERSRKCWREKKEKGRNDVILFQLKLRIY